ncbi:MAG: hypothetical protein J5879_10080 [Clostridia bacterium]|nr:hypothetical protein [Clostridia bacterium]
MKIGKLICLAIVCAAIAPLIALHAFSADGGVCFEFDAAADTAETFYENWYCGKRSDVAVSENGIGTSTAIIKRGSFGDYTVTFDIKITRGSETTASKTYFVSRIKAGEIISGDVNGLTGYDLGSVSAARPGYSGVFAGFSAHGIEIVVHTFDDDSQSGYGNVKAFFSAPDGVDFKSGGEMTVTDTETATEFYVRGEKLAAVKYTKNGDGSVSADITDSAGTVAAHTDRANVYSPGAVGFVPKGGTYTVGRIKMTANSGSAADSCFTLFDHDSILLKAGQVYRTDAEPGKTPAASGASGAVKETEAEEEAYKIGVKGVCVLIMFNVVCIGVAAGFFIMSDRRKVVLTAVAAMLAVSLAGNVLFGAGVIDIKSRYVTGTVSHEPEEERPALVISPVATTLDGKGNTPQIKLSASNQAAQDALGRKLPGYDEVGATKEGKYVGVFYLNWTTSATRELNDNTRILAQNPSDPQMGTPGEFHWWSEPEVGYADASDVWVIRRNMFYLDLAGVDYIYVDFTNGYIYEEAFGALLDTCLQMRAEGQDTPAIVPWCFGDDSGSYYDAGYLYSKYYSQEKYKTLWFYMDGKPLMEIKRIEENAGVYTKSKYLPVLDNKEMCDFFTFRYAWTTSPYDDGHFPGEPIWRWSWNCPIFFYPYTSGVYAYGWDEQEGVAEQMTISGGSYCNIGAGRSENRGTLDKFREKDVTGEGYYLEKQFKYLLKKHPETEYLNIQGWNEWMAQYFPELIRSGATSYGFVDQYNREFSRDLEPVKGAFTDNYYYQLCSIIRRFKGMEAPEEQSNETTIDMNGAFSQWDGLGGEYADFYNDTTWRDDTDPTGVITYKNETGRNDIVKSKVAYDRDSVYFYVQTAEDMTPYTDDNWMLLFIDGDGDPDTGWEGYDYLVNYEVIDKSGTVICEYKDGIWQETGVVSYRQRGNEMHIAVPRSLIGQTGGTLSFGFHWNDNVNNVYDLRCWFLEGDNAPERRNTYSFSAECAYGGGAGTVRRRSDPIRYMKAADVDAGTLGPGLLAEKYWLEPDYGKQPEIDLLMNAYGTEGNRVYSGIKDEIKLIGEEPYQAFALSFDGYIYVPEDADVHFTLRSDDGAALYVNDRLIVDNGGVHTERSESASVRLAGGFHKFRLEYFENGDGNSLLEYSCSVPGARFFCAGQGDMR